MLKVGWSMPLFNYCSTDHVLQNQEEIFRSWRDTGQRHSHKQSHNHKNLTSFLSRISVHYKGIHEKPVFMSFLIRWEINVVLFSMKPHRLDETLGIQFMNVDKHLSNEKWLIIAQWLRAFLLNIFYKRKHTYEKD